MGLDSIVYFLTLPAGGLVSIQIGLYKCVGVCMGEYVSVCVYLMEEKN